MIDPLQIARSLLAAERERRTVRAFTDEHPYLEEEAAYAAQSAFVRAKLDGGDTVVGYKLGLVSRAKQQAMKVDRPIFGVITSSMVGAYGDRVDLGRFIHPRVEPEIAFLLARDVTAPATVTSVLAATDVVFGAIDVLDSRYTDFEFRFADVVADNASSGLVLLGPRACSVADLGDLRVLGCVLRADGRVVSTAAGAAVMGHPAAAVAWLANRLGQRGEALAAGSLVLSGGMTAAVPLTAGHSMTAEFDGLGAVEVLA